MRQSAAVLVLLCVWAPINPADAEVMYVDDGAVGANSGTSWADAYTELQSALHASAPGDELWVAIGLYLPDFDVNAGTHTGQRSASFSLPDGVGVYGPCTQVSGRPIRAIS